MKKKNDGSVTIKNFYPTEQLDPCSTIRMEGTESTQRWISNDSRESKILEEIKVLIIEAKKTLRGEDDGKSEHQ